MNKRQLPATPDIKTTENKLNHGQLELTAEIFNTGIDIREPLIYAATPPQEPDSIHVINRDGWPNGPWDNEPDEFKFEFRTTHHQIQYPCHAVRNGTGVWCGYVGINSTHPLYKVEYQDYTAPQELQVHGGVTFTDYRESVIQFKDYWWIGFDCAHFSDVCPGMIAAYKKINMPYPHEDFESYKTLDFVKQETLNLAEQILAYELRAGHQQKSPKVTLTKLIESGDQD